MEFKPTKIPDVIEIIPKVWGDERGFFMETYHQPKFAELGLPDIFVQDNHSFSTQGVLRGLHYQLAPQMQGKLVRCIRGEIWDVAVDIRKASSTYGQWVALTLSAEQKNQLWIPAGFAHGFYTLTPEAEVVYKCTDVYAPDLEQGILWDDADLAIDWPLNGQVPNVSPKDLQGCAFSDCTPI